MRQHHNLNQQLNPQPQRSPPMWASFALNQWLDTSKFVAESAFTTLWELIFPRVCVHCERVDASLCAYCIQEIVPALPQDEIFLDEPGRIDGKAAIGQHTGPLRSAVHALKYNNDVRVAEALGSLLAEVVVAQKWSFDIIIPVPLHSKRLKERGYNQAERIAQSLALTLEREGDMWSDALYRTRETSSQVTKTMKERQANLQDAFAVTPAYQDSLPSLRVLLVDDVFTTGSTIKACAAALRGGGVSSIWAATVTQAQGDQATS